MARRKRNTRVGQFPVRFDCHPAGETLSERHVIKAFFLIFSPVKSWDRILQAHRSLWFLLLRYFLPMMLMAAGAEGFGMVVWGKPQTVFHRIQKYTVAEAALYEIARFLMMMMVVATCGFLIKLFAETFGKRHSFWQTLTLTMYGLSPLFLLRLFDATPIMSPWITWGIGVILCTEVLYQGVPRVMEPDPPIAFGLYFMSSLVLVATTGLERFATAWYLSGRMRPVKDILDGILGHFQG
jgi:hypothetical protein